MKAKKIIDIARGETSRLFFGGEDYADVSRAWMDFFKPERGGYFIVLEDGTQHYSKGKP